MQEGPLWEVSGKEGLVAGSMMEELSSCRVRILSGKTAGEVDRGCEKATCVQALEGGRVTEAAGAGPDLREAGVCRNQAPSGGVLVVLILLLSPIKLSSWPPFLAYRPHCRQY